MMTPEKEQQEAAAVTMQQQWRRRQAIHKQNKFHTATEQSILDIQSALRGHLTRKKVLSSKPRGPVILSSSISEVEAEVESSCISDSESSETSFVVERIQAALRGHAARQMILQDLPRYTCTLVCMVFSGLSQISSKTLPHTLCIQDLVYNQFRVCRHFQLCLNLCVKHRVY